MKLKRYQIATLFFALGIFTAGLFLSYIIKLENNPTIDPDSNQNEDRHRVVKIFFANSLKDPKLLDCSNVYPVERVIDPSTDNPQGFLGELIYLTVVRLLEGPSPEELNAGYFTSINDDTKVQKISVESGVASVDFNQKLDEKVAGSCKVIAIRSQITETLKQFSEITEVKISVDGDMEEILQP